ncbi:hypothetical protein HN51_010840 [Arachis hypogaea]|uniref:agamous-like MADS-box protein AGL12 n=1 Tax=Arachis hypogaea TaxID=3818 RepID=UPI000DECB50D|nr:agamous-like MADS-box protein AGL12 [Arachis hypogaea]
MARGRIQLKRIENPVHRQVTFCKRRAGLLKKAKELSVLCDAEIGLVIFSAHGKLYELATKGTMQGVIERYMKFTGAAQPEEPPTEPHHHPLDAKEEADVLKQEIDTLQKGISYLFGGGTGTMTIDDLQILEKNLETWYEMSSNPQFAYIFTSDEPHVTRNSRFERQGGYTQSSKQVSP